MRMAVDAKTGPDPTAILGRQAPRKDDRLSRAQFPEREAHYHVTKAR